MIIGADLMGSAKLSPEGAFHIGSFLLHAGLYGQVPGIDDQGWGFHGLAEVI